MLNSYAFCSITFLIVFLRILLLDLLTREALDLLPLIIQNYPRTIVIAFGIPGSDPLLQAQHMDIYATETDPVDRYRVNSLVQRALRHLELTMISVGFAHKLLVLIFFV